ncbi:MAG: ATP-grasp domain-containing protein [Methanobacteriaceae archaeon]|jgi:predicted ATP-grasp superfamily ATP-dependent carboligase|nr:ATP-grasp domain-containing protein [Candidatus Methanorudis spinitermitis]
MEKLLILGINTRAIVNSALKLGYITFSGSYFSTLDFKTPYLEKHILKQINEKSCDYFEKNYSYEKLLEISEEMMNEVDYIVLSTGISPIDFKGKFKKYKKKIIGNHNTKNVEDKFKFYKKIKNKFLTPKTFKVNYENIYEAMEIAKQHDDKEFIIKPLQGSGGYGVKYLNYRRNNEFKAMNFNSQYSNHEDSNLLNLQNQYFNQKDSDFLVQEFIPGENISSSILGVKNEAKAVINSKMLTEADFGIKNSFKYCGNIAPLDINILNLFNNDNRHNPSQKKILNINNINEVSEKLIANFKLLGSNGVDMIINNNSIYIIEINPRFQGTYELVENLLNINLLEAHIKACNNELVNIPKPEGYSIKKIIFSKEKSMIGNLSFENVYDVPYEGVIIEKNQPLATVIAHENEINQAIIKLGIVTKNIEERITLMNSK